jgi:hypothetical protein
MTPRVPPLRPLALAAGVSLVAVAALFQPAPAEAG